MAATAAADASVIICRLVAGEIVGYEDMESLDDMALADVRRAVDLAEEPGIGYRAGVTR
jgi:hypothetical protein